MLKHLATEKVKFAAKFIKITKLLWLLMSLQLLKHPSAKRTKNIIKLGLNAKYRRIMTGSPITKNPLRLV